MQEISSLQNEPQGPGRCLFSSSLPVAIHSMSAGACLLMDSPSISQTCLSWLPAGPLLLPLDVGLTLEQDVLSALVQQRCVSKPEVCRYRELMQRWQEKLSMEGGARLPCPLGRGQHGTQAPKAQPTLEDVAGSWILAGWDCNHGSSSFCIATWLGDPKKKIKK